MPDTCKFCDEPNTAEHWRRFAKFWEWVATVAVAVCLILAVALVLEVC